MRRLNQLRYRSRRGGMALVVTLALIILVSAAILAFFSNATFNRRVESSRANRTKADLVAQSGAVYAEGEILAEITSGSNSNSTTVNGVTVYKPKGGANACPERHLASGITPAAFPNLVRQSAEMADANASSHSVLDAARNGRTVGLGRWNAPCLLSGSGFTASSQLPHWIYADRKCGITGTASSTAIGRFAFNVYQIGGLLNPNIAGYPATVSGSAWLMSFLKGGEGGADLTRLPADSAFVTQMNVDGLAAFRFPDNPGAVEFVGRMLASSSNGFLRVQNNAWSNAVSSGSSFFQNRFASRQDLIRYAQRSGNDHWKAALPYLTHFSRSSNMPSSCAAPDVFSVRFPNSGNVIHYDDCGNAITYGVKAGAPVLTRRFSLAKLAWLTPTGPAPGLSGSDTAIQAAFGLKWNRTEERWDYVGPSGDTRQGAIKTLDQVAADMREPNFFEMLKAGILPGTLGGAPQGKTSADGVNYAMSGCPLANNDLFANKDLHVIQIGANIIDSADSDNYPTRIAMQFGGVDVEKAGVEDLPYFYTIDTAMFFTTAATSGTNTDKSVCNYKVLNFDFVWIPELFSVHRPSTFTNGPAKIQVEIRHGLLQQVGLGGSGFTTYKSMDNRANPIDLSSKPAIVVDQSHFADFRNGPKPVRDSGAANNLGTLAPIADASIRDVLGFRMFSYENPAEFNKSFPFYINFDNAMGVFQVSELIMALRYMTPGGNLKTYATLGGNEAFPSAGIDGFYRDDFTVPVVKQSESVSNLATSGSLTTVRSCALAPWDPRSARHSPGLIKYERLLAEAPNFSLTNGNHHSGMGLRPFYPADYFGATAPSYAWEGKFPQMAGFQDPDGVARQPDAYLGYSGSTTALLKNNTANPYLNIPTANGDYSARPLVLQRPFRSVAELGYVFRDVPWQSLNFFTANSGDKALLDLFSVSDEPVLGEGRVFLGSPHQAVIEARLSGAPQEPDGTLPLSASGSVSATTTNIQTIAAGFENYAFASGVPSAAYPINVADLAQYVDVSGSSVKMGSILKGRREAVVRALDSSQANTWNMLVDVVAQTGRFVGKGCAAGDFVVEGESRWWVSVAIDRYTGKIIDRQIEKVHE